MARKRRHRVERHPETGALMTPVEVSMIVGAGDIARILVEYKKRNPDKPIPNTREDVYDTAHARFGEFILKGVSEATDEDVERDGAEAEKIVRHCFPELFPEVQPHVLDSYLRPLEAADPDRIGPAFRLHCPVCGKDGQTTGAFEDDGATISIPMEGDCGHRWLLSISTQKGQTDVFATAKKNAPKDGDDAGVVTNG
jgi:hypothetical protein